MLKMNAITTATAHNCSPGTLVCPGGYAMNKKVSRTLLAVMLSMVCVLTGCQSLKAAPPVQNATSSRNNCYSLLYQLLEEQKDVSMLRFIKSEQSDVKILVKRIATTSGTGAILLEKLAKDDPNLRLDDIRLPPGEVATRAAIASAKEKELLSETGDQFELTLLLTQTEALSYAWHLAEVAGENDPQPEHARALAGISQDMQRLYQEVFGLLRSRIKSSSKIPAGTPAFNHNLNSKEYSIAI